MAELPNVAKPNEGAPAPSASTTQQVEQPDLAALLARLEVLEANQVAQEASAEESDPTYAETSDSADKSRYFEVSNERYKELGFAGPLENYSDKSKVNDLYMESDDYVEGTSVVSYAIRSLDDETVISYVLNRGGKKGVIYLDNK